MTRQNKANRNRLTQVGSFYRGLFLGETVRGMITDGKWAKMVRASDSFSFCPYPNPDKLGFMTCRREKRDSGAYWYGYRRIDSKTRKIYIGGDDRALDPFYLKALFEVLHSRAKEGE